MPGCLGRVPYGQPGQGGRPSSLHVRWPLNKGLAAGRCFTRVVQASTCRLSTFAVGATKRALSNSGSGLPTAMQKAMAQPPRWAASRWPCPQCLGPGTRGVAFASIGFCDRARRRNDHAAEIPRTWPRRQSKFSRMPGAWQAYMNVAVNNIVNSGMPWSTWHKMAEGKVNRLEKDVRERLI